MTCFNSISTIKASMFSGELHSFCGILQTIGVDEDLLIQKAIELGWQVRKPRKITPFDLLDAIYEKSHQTLASYNNLASEIDVKKGDGPARQAVAKRMNKECQRLIEFLIEKAFEYKLTEVFAKKPAGFLKYYNRVLVQDSTIIRLPAWLYEVFSGVSNGSSQVCNARIQATYDIKSMSLIEFSIDSYSKNDLKAAPELELLPGDLVLRDRGYLTMGEIHRHIQAEADCIYRHKTGTTYLDPITGEVIDLLVLLQENDCIDQIVMLNNSERTKVRLLSDRVDEETANLRRMKAKKENKGHNPSRAVLALMDWTIFITNVPKERATFSMIFAVYGLRWRIEIIFKAWKSHMNFDSIHRVSHTQLMIILKTRLLRIMIFTNHLYRSCYIIIRRLYYRQLSLLKFFNELRSNPERIGIILRCLAAQILDESDPVWESLRKYCCYEKRARLNYNQICDAIQFIDPFQD